MGREAGSLSRLALFWRGYRGRLRGTRCANCDALRCGERTWCCSCRWWSGVGLFPCVWARQRLSKCLTTIVASMPLPPDRRSCADPSRICSPLAQLLRLSSFIFFCQLLLPLLPSAGWCCWRCWRLIFQFGALLSPLSLSQSLTRSQSQRLVCFSWPFLYLFHSFSRS